MAYLTPDNSPTDYVCRAIRVPNTINFQAIVNGALLTLLEEHNWEQFGALTPNEAIEILVPTVYDALDGKGCRVIGEVQAFATSATPDGWLECDGSRQSRLVYPDLYAAIAAIFLDGADYFFLPDLRGKALFGTSLPDMPIGTSGGETAHTLSIEEMPTHAHSDSGHYHTVGSSLTGLALAPGELPVLIPNPLPGLSGAGSASISSSGNSVAHNNMPPYLALRYCIYATGVRNV